jgi:predicted  nucleic acid-binding Zn-ribbon protein
LQNIKATLLSGNETLEARNKELTTEISRLEEEEYIAKKNAEEASKGFAQVNEDLDKIRMDIESKKGEFYAKETDLKNKESELSIREENLKASESELSRKSDRIRLFKETL